uniref:Uncharacterized protein n=1 Tax=Fagus sylvatica TaxID=28930 RepID=A0A2N9FNG4_FAGSY
MNIFRRHYGVPDDVHLAYRFWEDALTGEPGDLILPLVAVIEGGVRFPIDPLLADFLDFFRISPSQISPNIFRIVNGVAELNRWLGGTEYFPGHRCPTVDGRPEEKKKQVQPHLTDPVALQAVYDSEVKDLAAALANPANRSDPAHDIRHMVGINLKKLLPPTRPQAEAFDPVLPGERKRKRKGPSKGDTSRPETMVGPFVPVTGSASTMGPAPLWEPTLQTLGERVAHLPEDMVVWKQSTNQEVINNLCRGLMMAVQGSLELGDRFQRQTAELENSLKVATRTFELRNEAERLRRDVEAYKDQALEADIMAREKAAFDRRQVEAQNIMTKQLPGVYNEAFQQGWKVLYSWPESDDMPELPPRENLPYPKAPIGVPEEELPDPLPESNEEASPSSI